MELLKFILWLTVGAVMGWFANQVVALEYRKTHKLATVKVTQSVKR